MTDDLKVLEDWIFRELRIDISAYKSNQMTRRLNNIIMRSGAATPAQYVKMLDRDPLLKQKLTDFITINVSEFFRNKELFQDFEEEVRKLLSKEHKRLKVWSAACSNGAEPYSVAIILDRISPGVKHTILATDIDETILKAAKEGLYTQRDVKNVDAATLKKYFTQEEGIYIIRPDIKKRVEFKKHDLVLEKFERGFDIILCRNVVIYFTSEVKERIYRQLSDSLNPGGLLFVGATESIYNFSKYNLEKASTFIYRKKL